MKRTGMGMMLAPSLAGCMGAEGAAWDPSDAPLLFTANLEYRVASLPMSGAAQNIPWASSYWPVYQDSINFKWAGASSDSSAKKYEKAFGGTGVEDAVSKDHGIDAQTSRKACTADIACTDLGTLFVSVHGYAAGSFTVKTADQ
jgi:hypothetical protein